jgi:adenine phosphoribosyltransferase
MSDIHTIKIGNQTRNLPIRELSNGAKIAFFQLLGDTKLTIECSKQIISKLTGNIDFIMAPEVKAIPLAFELARSLELEYIILRKEKKLYMERPLRFSASSFTSNITYNFWLDYIDSKRLEHKNLLIIDDVFTTGSTMNAMVALAKQSKVNSIKKAVVFVEGDNSRLNDLIFLNRLPIF